MHCRRVPEDSSEATQHSLRAAQNACAGLRVGLIQPGGEADTAGHRIQLRQGESVVRDQQVRPDHPRQFVFQRGGALQLDQFGGLAAVQPGADPGRLFARDALPVKEIHSAVKLQQHAPERFQFHGQIVAERERGGGNPPIHVGEQSAGGKPVANEMRAFGGGFTRGGNWRGVHRDWSMQAGEWAGHFAPRSNE